jgi:molecular chaperone Hsp33
MEKKQIYTNLRERLEAGKRDRMLHFILFDGTVRGALLHGTRLVNEMRANHELGILETLVLGHAYMGALLLSSNLKGDEKIDLKIGCDGPVKGINAEANSFGEVRGFLAQNPIPLSEPLESFDLRPFIGNGNLKITRYMEKSTKPYTSSTELRYGNIAQDLAYYSTVSEQIPSTYALSVHFDKQGNAAGAGGLMLQAMPGARDEDLIKIEQIVAELPSLGMAFYEGRSAESVLMAEFSEHKPEILDSRRVEFMCHCTRKRFGGFLRQLPVADLKEMAESDEESILLSCQKCNTEYNYTKNEIQAIHLDAEERKSAG